MHHSEQISAADWLISNARLRYIPDPARSGMAEAGVELDDDHPSDIRQARIALDTLARHTSTPGNCFACVWDGYGDPSTDPDVFAGPLVRLPWRRYALFTGSLTDLADWADGRNGPSLITPPAFVWPEDRRWCFTSDVDPHWAGVAAGHAAIDDLMNSPTLDVVAGPPGHAVPSYG